MLGLNLAALQRNNTFICQCQTNYGNGNLGPTLKARSIKTNTLLWQHQKSLKCLKSITWNLCPELSDMVYNCYRYFSGCRDRIGGILHSSLTYAARVRFRTRGYEWVKLVVGSLPCNERFFSGFSGFPLSSNINISKFQFDQIFAHLIITSC